MSIASTIQRIRAFAKQPGWTKTRLARQAGLQDTVLRGLDSEEWNPTKRTIEALESVIPPGWQAPSNFPAPTPSPSDAATPPAGDTSAAGGNCREVA
jgi:hypothetical protein